MIVSNCIKRSAFFFSVGSTFDRSKNYYKILEVSESANEKQIKKAFRNQAKKYHPDSTTGNEKKFKQINEAYQVLSSTETKRQYDQVRNSGSSSSRGGSSGQRAEGPYGGYGGNYGGSAYNQNNSNYSNTAGDYFYYESSEERPRSSQYRGYSRSDGWQNQNYREQILREIYEQQRRAKYEAQRANFSGGFEQMYRNHEDKIRQYNLNQKKVQEMMRKRAAQMEEELNRRREEQTRMAQEKFNEQVSKRVDKMKEGLVNNLYGALRMGQYIKDGLKAVKDAVSKKTPKK